MLTLKASLQNSESVGESRLNLLSQRDTRDVSIDDTLEQNLLWVVTETIHAVNNVLAGIRYAVHFLQDKATCEDVSNLELIQNRTDETAMILQSLYELVHPLCDQDSAQPLDMLCDRIQRLLTRRMTSHGIRFSVDVPSHFLVQGRHARLLTQLLYTYLWLRLGEMEEPGTLSLTAGEEDGAVWLRIADSASSIPSVLDDAEAAGPTAGEVSREQFARQCLKRLAKPLGPGEFRPMRGGGGWCMKVDPIEWLGG